MDIARWVTLALACAIGAPLLAEHLVNVEQAGAARQGVRGGGVGRESGHLQDPSRQRRGGEARDEIQALGAPLMMEELAKLSAPKHCVCCGARAPALIGVYVQHDRRLPRAVYTICERCLPTTEMLIRIERKAEGITHGMHSSRGTHELRARDRQFSLGAYGFSGRECFPRHFLPVDPGRAGRRLRNVQKYPDKDSCPLIKLARFGDKRSDKKSLRHDPNVIEITGIEGDYDGEVIDLGEAQTMIADARLTAVLYTSPSHTATTPRWRVLCPLSRPYAPKDHERFVARLNGAMGGILAPESYALSQSYYYGRVCDDYAVARVNGRFIDEADELDAKAVYAPKNGESRAERIGKILTRL